jgi:2-polyprenyl-3-methyl-5-hydroxy-6-metoxy-1,4-benzoquinol methylase
MWTPTILALSGATWTVPLSFAGGLKRGDGALEVNPDCSILDVRCGAGELLIELTGSVADLRPVGIDISEALIGTARDRAAAAGLSVFLQRQWTWMAHKQLYRSVLYKAV